MNSVYSDKQKRVIHGQERIEFYSFSSFHLIILTARVKGERQFTPPSTDDEDLIVSIGGKNFPKLTDASSLIDSPASFNGGKLHNLSQTVYFLTFLKGRNHQVVLGTDKPHSTATFESLEVYTSDLSEQLVLNVGKQAEDGDRRPWLTFVFTDLPIEKISADLTLKRRFIDSDDVKIVIDGETKRNDRSLLHKFWYLAASLLFGENQNVKFATGLSSGLHYIEFWADRMPIFHDLVANFGELPSALSGVPTAENPKWTEDFYDDTEEMILARAIFGEAEGVSEEAKTAVGWSIKNRVLAQREKEWGLDYHGVILKRGQFEAFVREDRLKKLTDPLNTGAESVKTAWFDSYRISEGVIKGNIPDSTDGATNFYSTPIDRIPPWAIKEREKVTIGNLHFYKL